MLLAEIAKALKQAFGARQRNAEGDYRPDPMAERFPSEEFQRRGLDAAAADEGGSRRSRSSSSPPLSPGKVSLMGLVEDWWRETKAGGMSLSTYESYRNTARKFGQFLKHDDAARVSAEDIIRYKDLRIANGINHWTVKAKDIAGLRMVLRWAVSNRRLTANTAEGVKVAGSKKPKMQDRGFSEEHLCLASSVIWLPGAVLCDEGVGEDDELSHDGDEGDLGLFSCGAESVIDGLEVWIAARGGKGGHGEGAAQLRASAADMAGAGLLVRERADFGKADDQGDSRRGPDPRDRGQDGEPPGQARIGGDEAFDLRLEMGERGLDSADLALDLGDRHGDGGFAELVEERGAGGDGRVPAAQHVPQGLHECAGRGGRAWLHALAEDGQHPSVDAVGLGQGAGGLGEQARAQRIDDSDSEALRNEAAMGGAVELSGRLHDHKRHLVAFKGTLQAPEAVSVVGDGELRPERVEVDVESGFTDVDTDVDLGCASFGQNLALHAGLAPHHLFRTSAKGGRIHLIRGSQEPREPRSRPPDPRRAAAPRGSARISIRFGLQSPCKGGAALAPDPSPRGRGESR
jgi:hypothetical protein